MTQILRQQVLDAASRTQPRLRHADRPLGRTIKQELSKGWIRAIQHSLTAKLDDHNWTGELPVYMDCIYLNGRCDEHGMERHSYAAAAPFIDSS